LQSEFALLRSLSTFPMGCLLGSVPADRHAAPPANMTACSIDEQKCARRPLANLHVGEVLRAYEVRQRSGYREQE